MMSSDNGKDGEGRGLPVGVEWEATDYGAALCNGDGARIAEVSRKGNWTAMSPSGWALANGCAADGAAAQAAAEAALWRRDGFGVGEVRGLPLPAILPYKQTPTALPGLAGLWRVTRWALASIGEGVEVDAVRVPALGRCPACGAILPATGIGCESCGWMGEPLPDDERAPVEPAPSREPSTPTDDGELARLLPGLPSALAMLRRWDTSGPCPGPTTVDKVVDACELLLAERERMTEELAQMTARASVADSLEINTRCALGGVPATAADPLPATTYTHDAAKQLRARAEEAERRVAELETMVEGGDREARFQRERADAAERHVERAMKDSAAAVSGWTKTGKDLEAARARLAALAATPPPHTVAALLAKVEARRSVPFAGVDDPARTWREAASLIRATLGAPTPLDRAAAEVCAVADDDARLDAIGRLRSIANGARLEALAPVDPREALKRIARVALDGMLAYDAPPPRSPPDGHPDRPAPHHHRHLRGVRVAAH